VKKICSLLLLTISITVKSQELKKYSIGRSNCAVYLFCDPGKFEISYSQDSSTVYTGECVKDSFTYGIICVKLKDSVSVEQDAAALLKSYLDFLKEQFSIRQSAGYGLGMQLNNREDIIGMIDYWQDENKKQWSIQGWTDGKILSVMYVTGNTLADYNKQQVFFKGFRFQGM
jgi:hypothetical protein